MKQGGKGSIKDESLRCHCQRHEEGIVIMSSVLVTVEMLDKQIGMSCRQIDICKSQEKPGLSSKRRSD